MRGGILLRGLHPDFSWSLYTDGSMHTHTHTQTHICALAKTSTLTSHKYPRKLDTLMIITMSQGIDSCCNKKISVQNKSIAFLLQANMAHKSLKGELVLNTNDIPYSQNNRYLYNKTFHAVPNLNL